MTGADLPLPDRSRFWSGILVAALAVGAYLRLQQIAAQVLIDDEWHAVHQFIARAPGDMFFDFGYADYSIPLGIFDWYQAQWWGVSELTLRWPMLACGLVALVVLPLYVVPRLGRPTAAVFALLLATSPLLVIFSRMARPYAITLLLGWIAHGAYQRYHDAARGRAGAGMTYAVAAALATWLHPVVGPFVVAPLLWGLAALRHTPRADRRASLSCAGSPSPPPRARSSPSSCCRHCSRTRCRLPPRAASTPPTRRHWPASGTPGSARRRPPSSSRAWRWPSAARRSSGARCRKRGPERWASSSRSPSSWRPAPCGAIFR